MHYKLLNNPNLTGENIGSIGALASKWTKAKVIREAEKYKTPTEFFTKSAGAYDAALRYKMMNKETFPWFYSNRMPPRWWNDKGHVFEESKKYTSRTEFAQNSPTAYQHACEDKTIFKEMPWIKEKKKPNGYWDVKEHVMEEGKKYRNRKAFSESAYTAWRKAKDYGWIDEIEWAK